MPSFNYNINNLKIKNMKSKNLITKTEGIRKFILSNGGKLTNKEMAKKLNIELMPLAGIIAAMKRGGTLKNNFLKSEIEKKSNTNKNISPSKSLLNINNVKFNNIATIEKELLTKELIQGIAVYEKSYLKDGRIYSSDVVLKIVKKFKKPSNTNKLQSETYTTMTNLKAICEKCQFIQIL